MAYQTVPAIPLARAEHISAYKLSRDKWATVASASGTDPAFIRALIEATGGVVTPVPVSEYYSAYPLPPRYELAFFGAGAVYKYWWPGEGDALQRPSESCPPLILDDETEVNMVKFMQWYLARAADGEWVGMWLDGGCAPPI